MRHKKRRILCMALICLLIFGSFSVQAAENITPSKKNYGVEFHDANNVYLTNQTPVDIKLGTKFFLTYTVTSLASDLSTQSGVIITQDKDEIFPYTKGYMKYRTDSALLNEGVTYFYRFELTEEGMVCTASWAKGEESDYIGFPLNVGDTQSGCKHFGVWFGGDENTKINGLLTRVRCYDEKGRDLGVSVGKSTFSATVYDPEGRAMLEPMKNIFHSYSFTLQDAINVAISNAKYTKEQVVYMEYTVKSVSKDSLTWCALLYDNSPTAPYPSGVWKQNAHVKENYPGCKMLIPGATYLVRYEVTDEGMDAQVKYVVDDEVHYFTHPISSGEKIRDCGYFSLWFGEGAAAQLSAEFVDFKCYDENGKNLGIQTNQNVKIAHCGGWEDYSQCIAAYYNPEYKRYIWLEEDNIANVETQEETIAASYTIEGNTLSLKVAGATETYEYLYSYMTDSEGIRYNRLKDNKVKFLSGLVTGKEVNEVMVTAKTGFKVEEPKKPKKEGNTFVEWCYADGTAFDFDTVVMNATTLYAKWQDGNGNTYLAVHGDSSDWSPIIIGAICLLLVAGTGICGMLIARKRGKASESNDKE